MRSISRRLLLLAVFCGSAFFAGQVAPASASRPAAETCQGSRSHPIVFVHGLEKQGLGGTDADAYWLDVVTELRSLGWCSDLVRVGFYVGDREFEVSLDDHGDHQVHFGGAGEHVKVGGVWRHTNETDIRHLAYHLAWTIYDLYTSQGVAVEAVGHSMGGLMIRYAIAQVQRGNPDFPPSLMVAHAVTLGTPNGGGLHAGNCDLQECVQMRSGSAFLRWLDRWARDPQGTGGTDWTAMGSEADQAVTAASALDLDADHKVDYLAADGVGHFDYLHLTSPDPTASVTFRDRPGPWQTTSQGLWPAAWLDLVLSSPGG